MLMLGLLSRSVGRHPVAVDWNTKRCFMTSGVKNVSGLDAWNNVVSTAQRFDNYSPLPRNSHRQHQQHVTYCLSETPITGSPFASKSNLKSALWCETVLLCMLHTASRPILCHNIFSAYSCSSLGHRLWVTWWLSFTVPKSRPFSLSLYQFHKRFKTFLFVS